MSSESELKLDGQFNPLDLYLFIGLLDRFFGGYGADMKGREDEIAEWLVDKEFDISVRFIEVFATKAVFFLSHLFNAKFEMVADRIRIVETSSSSPWTWGTLRRHRSAVIKCINKPKIFNFHRIMEKIIEETVNLFSELSPVVRQLNDPPGTLKIPLIPRGISRGNLFCTADSDPVEDKALLQYDYTIHARYDVRFQRREKRLEV